MAYYPPGALVTAVDRNECMLERARQRAQASGLDVDLRVMDAQHLDFPDSSFDSAVATLVFCSVSDPVLGLRELGRVVKPGGRIYLIEHMRSDAPWLGRLIDGLDWVLAHFSEERFARRTVDNVRLAGLHIERVQNLWWTGIVRLIVASPGVRKTASASEGW
jgi:ubiquinone/menaquinone biosynthesis C-methylase UbiE